MVSQPLSGFLSPMRALALLAPAFLILAACASNPSQRPIPIDYRTVTPGGAQRPAPAQPRGTPPPVVASPAAPGNPDVSSSPAVQQAAAMRPETGTRPGGPMLQPRDDPSARAIRVQRGESLYEISRRHSVNMRALIETNRLEPPFALEVGQVIYLPPPNIHVVQPGETLYSVSRRYNVDTRSLALMNSMTQPWTVWPGDELLLPPLARDQLRGSPPAAMSVAAAPAQPAARPPAPASAPVASAPAAASGGMGTAAANRYAVNPATPGQPFIWPVSGPVLRGFGQGADGQRNDGVNIAVQRGAEVRAAAAGEVVYAGNDLAGFGNLLLIRHQDGWVTAYAHSEILLVKEGDRVGQGAVIARAGQTGSVSRPQVHFELRRGRDPVDPTAHLPRLQDRLS